MTTNLCEGDSLILLTEAEVQTVESPHDVRHTSVIIFIAAGYTHFLKLMIFIEQELHPHPRISLLITGH